MNHAAAWFRALTSVAMQLRTVVVAYVGMVAIQRIVATPGIAPEIVEWAVMGIVGVVASVAGKSGIQYAAQAAAKAVGLRSLPAPPADARLPTVATDADTDEQLPRGRP